MADLAVTKNGDIVVADGEGPNTRVAKFAKDGAFIKWWGGKGTEPGQFNVPHSIAVDSRDRIYVADRSNNRVQIFDKNGKFLNQWTNVGVPWGLCIKGELMYLVDGSDNNCLARDEPQRRPDPRQGHGPQLIRRRLPLIRRARSMSQR
jgi:DNA-binding beta-propeller fold protein YncE